MRRDSATVVALVGRVSGGLLAAVAESPNVSVVRTSPASQAGQSRPAGPAQPGQSAATAATAPAPGTAGTSGWQPGATAMREAARRKSTYVLVPDDPLAGVAAAWQAMWDVTSAPGAATRFAEAAADALAAWQQKRFELPDYYLVVVPAEDTATGPDLYLGPLRAARPRRVAIAATSGPAGLPGEPSPAGQARPAGSDRSDTLVTAVSLLDALRSLEHGPWWPPLDELLDLTRRFYAGGLAETQHAPV